MEYINTNMELINTTDYKILYHISNYRTPIKPQFHDFRNLYDLPSDYEREYCWKCGHKTKRMNCEKCGSDKFFMTNK